MDFRLTCGHTVYIPPQTSFFRVIREQPRDTRGAICMRCYLTAKSPAREEHRRAH